MRTNSYTVVFFFSLIFFGTDCSRNPMGPGPFKNPREYKWTIDTINTGHQTLFNTVWGSSSNDIYTAGWMGGYHNIYHFNGSGWTSIDVPARNLDVYQIFGFAAGDVWLVGGEGLFGLNGDIDTSLVLHYDGKSWTKIAHPGGRLLQSIDGVAPTDIWAAGWNMVLHWDGIQWQNVDVPLYPQGMQFMSIAAIKSNDVYMTGYRNDVVQPIDSTAVFLYHFDGSNWAVVDSSIQTVTSPVPKFGELLKRIGNTLYGASNGVFRQDGNTWQQIFDETRIFRVNGTSGSNMFAVGIRGAAFHYDGVSWYEYTQLEKPDYSFGGVWTDGAEAFIVGSLGNSGIICHGK